MNDQSPTKGVSTLPAIQNLAKVYDLSAEHFVYTFRLIAMPDKHTDAEFVSCCLVAREHGLNPLTKEIYFMRDKHGKIQAIVGVDGWIKKCNEHPQYDGVEFVETTDSNGKITAVKTRIFRKDRSHPIEITEYLSECQQKREKQGPWDTHPSRMLRWRSFCQCSRLAFGFAGIMERDEFEQWQAMRDVTPAKPVALEIPDIPDVPVGQTPGASEPVAEQEEPLLGDPDGFLDLLADQLALCDSPKELSEICEANADMIARLPKEQKAKAAKMLQEAAE